MPSAQMTIGELAGRAGLRTSALRYYERQGLLVPTGRNESGYRVYEAEAENTLRFIQRAQRIGFSLDDIKALLAGLDGSGVSDRAVLEAAEERFIAVERRLTELLVTRHELEHFLADLSSRLEEPDAATKRYDGLIMHVCGNQPGDADMAGLTLKWLLERTGCALADGQAHAILAALAGVHVHVWKREGDYCILVPGDDPAVGQALEAMALIEAECHAHPTPTLRRDEDGWLFVAEGDDAYLFAQFFLALEGRGDLSRTAAVARRS